MADFWPIFRSSAAEPLKMAPTDEFFFDFNFLFDFDLDTSYILIGGGPHHNLKI